MHEARSIVLPPGAKHTCFFAVEGDDRYCLRNGAKPFIGVAAVAGANITNAPACQ
jgi:hypothetical protein